MIPNPITHQSMVNGKVKIAVNKIVLASNKTDKVEEVAVVLVEIATIELMMTTNVSFVLKIIQHQNVQIGQQMTRASMNCGV